MYHLPGILVWLIELLDMQFNLQHPSTLAIPEYWLILSGLEAQYYKYMVCFSSTVSPHLTTI